MASNLPSLFSRLETWQKALMAVLSLGGLLWGWLMFFNPIGEIDLTVRIAKEIPVTLPSGVNATPLQLMFEGSPITHALLVQLEIANSGSVPVGNDQDAWRLNLKKRTGESMVLLPPLTTVPGNLSVTAHQDSALQTVSLDIGLFNPGDVIVVSLVLIEPDAQSALPVEAETRIPGLSRPITTRQDIQGRLRDAFILPVWGILLLFSLGAVIGNQYKRANSSDADITSKEALYNVMGFLFPVVFVTAFLATGITWVLAWIVTLVL
jgi:hypothetical protein